MRPSIDCTPRCVGGATAIVFAHGNVYSAPDFAAGLPGRAGNGVSTSSNLEQSTSEVVSISFWVPRGETIRTDASLQVTSYTNPGGSVVSDFSGSFRFNPDAFFTINTPGITANSVSMGLVNNRLAGDNSPPVAVASILVNAEETASSSRSTGAPRSIRTETHSKANGRWQRIPGS